MDWKVISTFKFIYIFVVFQAQTRNGGVLGACHGKTRNCEVSDESGSVNNNISAMHYWDCNPCVQKQFEGSLCTKLHVFVNATLIVNNVKIDREPLLCSVKMGDRNIYYGMVDRLQKYVGYYLGSKFETAPSSIQGSVDHKTDVYFSNHPNEDRNILNRTILKSEAYQTRAVKRTIVKLAVVMDNSFCAAQFQNNTESALSFFAHLHEELNGVFSKRSSTIVLFKYSYIEINCNNSIDRYKSIPRTPSETKLDRFRLMWYEYHPTVERDVTYWFTGYTDESNHVGRAYVASTCDKKWSYGYIEAQGRDERQSKTITSTFLHEVGHSLGAFHSDTGIMKEIVNGQENFVSKHSIGQINDFLENNFRSRCLTKIFGLQQ